MRKIIIINGPNINMLGKREPNLYGYDTWELVEKRIEGYAKKMNIDVSFFQSNIEGEIVNHIQQLENVDGIVINPAAFTIGGYSIVEALLGKKFEFIEVHISNI